ncbi:DUF1750-domain-containing protein [Delitschia confertaspora ATCC 74209]|uniref:DUF1750-domain-containing protein n=1 Tax=Delitschia confertaspora ATCC 74209 TaxID=1513339 RepID=A0A9P4JFJ7_9PLEO|nr:DUF1750-domain-containing protein [Delitschia confertaspora ATCC 74209]
MNQHHMAQDPSAGVPRDLLPHVHLVSSYKFPVIPSSLQPANALEYLLNAPKIVNDAAPMSWTYFDRPPQDGTVILTWQPPLLQGRFASDGLAWADPEVQYQTEIQGYSLEILIHRSGIRYGLEPVAMHQRARYRIVGKAAGAPLPVDPSLWIIHYTQADPSHRFPAAQIPIAPETQLQMQQRNYFAKQGQLQRKEFMLRDRNNWPEVKFSAGIPMPGVHGQPRPYYNPMNPMASMARPPQYQHQPQVPSVGPPPPKRARQAPPTQQPAIIPSSNAGTTADNLEEEEAVSLGDQLDFLTPKEISSARFKQHHEWMEEILSSPYAVHQIVPLDLGLGLMGELAPLTDGLLDAPTSDSFTKITKDPVTSEPADTITIKTNPKDYYKLDPEQLAAFEKRVADYTAKEEAALERMKDVHAKKMAELKRSRTYIKAERRLRDVARNGLRTLHDSQVSDGSPSEDPADGIVEELEKSLGVTFEANRNVVCVDKGGYVEEQPAQPAPEPPQQISGNGTSATHSYTDHAGLNGLIDEGAIDTDNTAASLLDQYGSTSLTGTPGANASIPQMSQPQSQSHSAVATPSNPSVGPMVSSSYAEQTNIATTGGENDLVDLDVEMSGMNNTNAEEKIGEGDWVMVDQNNPGEHDNSGGDGTTTEQPSTTSVGVPASSIHQTVVSTSGMDADTTTSMFDNAEFGSFDNLDTAGDALADYTNAGDDLGLDLDNSAFGDAFHGTEPHHGTTEDGDHA